LATVVALSPGPALTADTTAQDYLEPTQGVGRYFWKKEYVPAPLPKYEEVRSQLPSPIDDDHPLWVETYWKAWELAFSNFHEPAPSSGLVSQFIDAAFDQSIFLWDSSFMTLFTNLASPLVPGISTLDNFYAKQQADGEISREIVRDTGRCYPAWVNHECTALSSRMGWIEETAEHTHNQLVTYTGRAAPTAKPIYTLEALNHPILAWAELESYRVTGDKNRLEHVWEPLVRYYLALQRYLQQGNGLYMTDWASMDNSPRTPYLVGGGTAVDTSSEIVLFARDLSQIASILAKKTNPTSTFARQTHSRAPLTNSNGTRSAIFTLT